MKKKPSYSIITEQIAYVADLTKIKAMQEELIEYIFDREFHNCLGENDEGQEMWISDGTEFPINEEYEKILEQPVFIYEKLISSTPPTEIKEQKKYERLLSRKNEVIEETDVRTVLRYIIGYNLQPLEESPFEVTDEYITYK